MPPAEPHELSDPRAFRWVESGVSGLARAREWDATALVELPELSGEPLAGFELVARRRVVRSEPAVPAAALERVAAELDSVLARPYRARAVRQGLSEWLVGAVELRSEEIELAGAPDATRIEVAYPPGGVRHVLVDGEQALEPLDPSLAAAVDELERRGSKRFESFVARVDKVEGDRWDLTIDPL